MNLILLREENEKVSADIKGSVIGLVKMISQVMQEDEETAAIFKAAVEVYEISKN